ncbi:MAG: hypothetical protein GXO30_07130 [Epsilonproteobacteria bacterium]|nr:hypothetical protein [Campylobacterota bacterium]
MKIQTKYSYEKNWTTTNEKDLLKIIVDEIGDVEPQGTLLYIKESVKKGKTISVGSCKFRLEPKGV